MIKKFSIIAIVLAVSLPLVVLAHNEPHTRANSKVVKKSSAIWIDVRTPQEYQAGHLSDSINIPVDKIASQIVAVAPNKSTPINLYCRSGRRAEEARKILLSMGYANVVNHGGYDDLKRQGIR